MKTAVRIKIICELRLPDRPLQIGEQQSQRLRVVPDMGAGTGAGTVIPAEPLPSPDRSVLQTQKRGRLQYRKICRDSFQRRTRNGRGKKRVMESEGPLAQFPILLPERLSRVLRILPDRGIVASPEIFSRIVLLSHAFLHLRIPGVLRPGRVPGDDKTETALLSGSNRGMCRDAPRVPAASASGGGIGRIDPVFEFSRRGEVVPKDLQRIAPAPPEPVLLIRNLGSIGGKRHAAGLVIIGGKTVLQKQRGDPILPDKLLPRFRIRRPRDWKERRNRRSPDAPMSYSES